MEQEKAMDIRQVLYPFINDQLLHFYWASLDLEEKFMFRDHIHSYLSLCAKDYCMKNDKWVLYDKISIKYSEIAITMGYPVDWKTDLHMDSDNAQNYFDNIENVLKDLATLSNEWFCEILPYGPEISTKQLKEMALGFISGMGIWKKYWDDPYNEEED